MISSKVRFTAGLLSLFAIAALASAAPAKNNSTGAVYTISNAADTNRVHVFTRGANGSLKEDGAYPTGGKGVGVALGSQGALALSEDGRWLLVVNAGSNDISVFSVRNNALVLTDIAASGGRRPISVTIADNLVYVLNAGGTDASENISGLYLSERGQLHPLPGSTQLLSGANRGPAQVSFGLGGDVLVVTEKTANRIEGFTVDDFGLARSPAVTVSAGPTPFGFAISSKGYVFVSEAPNSALSSYRLNVNGSLDLVTASRANQQMAACWVVLSKNEKYAYTANASSNTITGYRIAPDSSVTLLNTNGITAVAGDGVLDLAVSNNGRYLYSLNTKSRTIVGFQVGDDGELTRVADVGGVAASAVGLVAR